MNKRRQLKGNITIPRDDVRTMIRQLRKNRILWIAPDQDFGRKRSVFAPFFGIETASITAVSKLARISGASVILTNFYRSSNHKGYEINLSPALQNFPSADLQKDATRLNQHYESSIRKHPEQYLWAHRKFKTRPQGQPSFYKKRR